MPVHFAAARSTTHSPIARALACKAHGRAINDNGDGSHNAAEEVSFDETMRAALRHFAEHGMHAARQARRKAEEAHAAGDAASFDWWLGICRTLDRRLAQSLERQLAAGMTQPR